MADFLFELGLEEVPARMLASGEAELAQRVRGLLERERLLDDGAEVESFSTPRRLAVLVRGILGQQADADEEMVGPPVKAAFKDGEPTAAAHAFAKKAGVDLGSLKTVTTPKGEYLLATVKHAGRSAAEIVAAELPKEVAGIYWAKSMYWRAGKPERFVRPVQWMLALLDGDVVPVEWAGVVAGRLTYGHRVLHGSTPIEVSVPSAYKEALRVAFVLVDVEERRQKIRKALDHVMRTVAGARWREDHALVDKVTHLTEWPSVVMGSFEADFLRLPEEVLVTVMRDHQNYFAPEGVDGKLLPYFLAVLNTEVQEPALGVIRHGNERVLRARFNDARFFYEFDQRVPLVERIALLEKVTFQKELGSYAAKTERVTELATRLAEMIAGRGTAVDYNAVRDAATLCKTDLTTELVKEFTELQGVVGGLYARAQGVSESAARAIYDHYLPASMEDAIPSTNEGLVLSIADKADTIAGMFGLGLQPTGSKDPFALRRAANGVVKMLAESALPLTLEQVAYSTAGASVTETQVSVKAFLLDRLEWYVREARGFAYDSVKAVLSTGHTDVQDALARVDAVEKARSTEDFLAVSAAFKRMKNIVEQARAKGEVFASRADGLNGPEEAALIAESSRVGAKAEELRSRQDYLQALQVIATVRPAVDAFFDKVMVMAPETELRAARLGLLERILRDFSKIADFSEIVTAG